MLFLSKHVILILVGLPAFVFVAMLVLFSIGRRVRRWRSAADPTMAADDLGPIKAAVFGLLGLLIAFTFAGAAGRYDKRRDLAVQEAVAIGNAWDCVATLPVQDQAPIRDGLRRYVASRLETYRRLPDVEAGLREAQRTEDIAGEIWREAVSACATPRGQPVRLLVLRSLETAFDLFRVRVESALHHPPLVIWIMLFLLSLAGALIAGYGVASMSRGNWIYVAAFAASTAIAVYVILDMEFPRAGLVQVDAADQLLADTLERMK